jgi:hypothetical protein
MMVLCAMVGREKNEKKVVFTALSVQMAKRTTSVNQCLSVNLQAL